MTEEIVWLKVFNVEGFTCRILETDLGHLCGYVLIPKDNPLHEMDYGDEKFPDLSVHGGVTFSGRQKDGEWAIGFDCAHWGDAPRADHPHAQRLQSFRLHDSGTYRDEAYVTKELEELAHQIKRVRRVETSGWKLVIE